MSMELRRFYADRSLQDLQLELQEAESTGDTVKASELMQVMQDDAFVRSLPGYGAYEADQRRQAYAGRFGSLKEVIAAQGELQRQHDQAELAADDDLPMSRELEDLNALVNDHAFMYPFVEKNREEREANYQGMDADQLVSIVEKAKSHHLLDRDNNLETDDFRVLANRHKELAVTWNRPEQFEQDVIDYMKPGNVVEVYEDEPESVVDWTPSPHSKAGKDIKALKAMWSRLDRRNN